MRPRQPRAGLTCSANACSVAVWAQGVCGRHYQKLLRFGDPNAGGTRAPNGAGHIDAGGYHRRSENGVEKPEHVRIAERALGKPLPVGAMVHHADENKLNNEPNNLVICPSLAYHNLIHQRIRALAACGNPDWRKCCRCGTYDDPQNMGISGSQAYHRECNARHVQSIYAAKRSAA